MPTHDYLWSWLILCDCSYVIRCDHNLIRYHVVFGFEWHLATSHAWRSNPQTRWRYHRAIGWHKKKQITKVRLELVPFVQVSSVFVFNHLFIGCHGESPLILCFSYRGWSQSILDLICQHPLPREWWPDPHSRPSLLKIFGGSGWANAASSFVSGGMRSCWRPFWSFNMCHVAGSHVGKHEGFMVISGCLKAAQRNLLRRPWLMIQWWFLKLSEVGLFFWGRGADFRILN